MGSDIESYKARISSYSVSQLEEILLSLDRNRFPDKYDVVKKALHRLKSEDTPASQPPPPSDNLDKTIVDEESLNNNNNTALGEEPSEIVEPTKQEEELDSKDEKVVNEQLFEKETADKNKADQVFNPDETDNEDSGPDIFQVIITVLVSLTSIIALYCILLINFDLPGKTSLEKISLKLPGAFTVQESDETTKDNAASTTEEKNNPGI